ncbi:hypothetical protein Mycch_5945 (plasmid) [Mycolicibacterium chubuense NBB4]|uniref:DUF779 domain-containing protein n=1 Tax=Mycolicibacterium chubuense (strain NBB4) TaxID=710421 RepID=I4BTE4_MYCCN|nr:DUF779 domain-containing protein [Mycolicibacterium chubuense]AFM20551.1 hypothetical protein Mycch_5945 [Mycolicibacterium chubuense NBB4]
MPTPTNRVSITPQAAEVLQHLIDIHGPVMFHQSGGCCDGSAPMCYPNGEFRVGAADVLLGHIHHETPFWISADQYLLHEDVTAVTYFGRLGEQAGHDPAPFDYRCSVGTRGWQ